MKLWSKRLLLPFAMVESSVWHDLTHLPPFPCSKAKRLIKEVVSQHEMNDAATGMAVQSGTSQPGSETMLIPAERVGLIIGKGGETISSLQMQTGAKLQMVQDDPHAREKPLLISGAPEAVARARHMVLELISERGPPGPDAGGYASGAGVTMKLPVSTRDAILRGIAAHMRLHGFVLSSITPWCMRLDQSSTICRRPGYWSQR